MQQQTHSGWSCCSTEHAATSWHMLLRLASARSKVSLQQVDRWVEKGERRQRQTEAYIQCSVMINNYLVFHCIKTYVKQKWSLPGYFWPFFGENRERGKVYCETGRCTCSSNRWWFVCQCLTYKNKSKQFSNLGENSIEHEDLNCHETQLQHIYTAFDGRTLQSCWMKCKSFTSERENILQSPTGETWH